MKIVIRMPFLWGLKVTLTSKDIAKAMCKAYRLNSAQGTAIMEFLDKAVQG